MNCDENINWRKERNTWKRWNQRLCSRVQSIEINYLHFSVDSIILKKVVIVVDTTCKMTTDPWPTMYITTVIIIIIIIQIYIIICTEMQTVRDRIPEIHIMPKVNNKNLFKLDFEKLMETLPAHDASSVVNTQETPIGFIIVYT